MSKRTWTDEDLITAVKESKNKTEVLRKLGLSCHNSGNYQTIDKYIKKLNLQTDHFENGISHHLPKSKIPTNEILVSNSSYSKTVNLKNRLIAEGLLKEACSECGISHWRDEKLNLHIDHINGDRTDNNLSNLRLLCPNCHSLTPTYCRGINKIKSIKTCSCGNMIQNRSSKCFVCSMQSRKGKTKIVWPDLDTLNKMILELGFSKTGKQLGVSDNAIRKHIKNMMTKIEEFRSAASYFAIRA